MTRRGFLAKLRKSDPGIPAWPDFQARLLEFHKSWVGFVGTAFGCEDLETLENCRPHLGILSFKRYLRTRTLAKKLFHLKDQD